MDEDKVLNLAKKSVSLERGSHIPLEQINYDLFRKQVSKKFLRLFEMPKSDWSKHKWKNGVNLAMQM